MKTLSGIIIFLFAFIAVSGQMPASSPKEGANRNMAVDFSVGYSTPIGAFGKFNRDDKTSGYAAGGFQFQACFDWMGKKHLGLSLQYTYLSHTFKDTASNIIPDGMKSPLGPGSWTNHCLMFGPVFMTNFGKLHFDAKILGGFMLSFSPVFSTPDPTDTTGSRINQNTGTGFGYQISAGVGYTISPHVAFKFNLSLLGGWPSARKQYTSQLIGYEKVKNEQTGLYYYTPVYSAPVDYEIKKAISTLNPSIGLVYRF